jgi:hypothetical protein
VGLAVRQRTEILKMQRQFTATGIITLIVMLGAGILLTVSLQKAAADNLSVLPSWILWGAEFCLYLGALLIWAPNATFPVLMLGLIAMFGLRLAIGVGSAYAFSLIVDSSKHFPGSIDTFIFAIFPRGCSIVFALMAFYPMRAVLPRKGERPIKVERPVKKTGSQDFVFAGSFTAQGNFQKGGGIAAKTSAQTGSTNYLQVKADPLSQQVVLPENLKNYKISLPLAAIEMQLPSGFLRPDLLERLSQDSLEVSLPLTLIAPQLKEALLEIDLSDLLALLPKGWGNLLPTETETKITLPLSVVIPQVPEELFAVPTTIAPVWSKAVAEDEKVLFARV